MGSPNSPRWVLSVTAAQELLKAADASLGGGIDTGKATEVVVGLIVAARIIDADLTPMLHRGVAAGPSPVQPVELEAGMKRLELEVRRAVPGWEKTSDR